MLRLLSLIVDCRTLLSRSGFAWGRLPSILTSPLWWLRAWRDWAALLLRRAGTLDILRPGSSLLRRTLLLPLRRCGRSSLHCLLLIVLPHYRVTRLVAVILGV